MGGRDAELALAHHINEMKGQFRYFHTYSVPSIQRSLTWALGLSLPASARCSTVIISVDSRCLPTVCWPLSLTLGTQRKKVHNDIGSRSSYPLGDDTNRTETDTYTEKPLSHY